jgi:hypothetical protein
MRWATAPILVGITFGLWVFGIPLDARFALGRSELDLFASSVLERGDSINPPARVGTYRIQRWSVDRFDEGSVRFLVKERGMDGLSGFAFSPNERPRRSNGDRYYHLQGPWYVWEARFD